MPISELAYYIITPCCNSEASFNMFWDDELPILQTGVYKYLGVSTEELTFNECYYIELVQGSAEGQLSILDNSLFEQTVSKSCEEAVLSNDCGCLDSYKIVNCFDETLGFDFVPEEGSEINVGDIISLDLNPGDVIAIGDNNLCISDFTIVHPEINGGNPISFEVVAVEQTGLWNGKPYYKVTLTENDHSVPGLELTYYFIWNSNQWEVWDNFTLGFGPSSLCGVNFPLAVLENGCENPIDEFPCNYCTSIECIGFNSEDCNSYISGIRDVRYCSQEITIGDFINCWKVIANIQTTLVHPTFKVLETYTDCEECLEQKNQPPCIKATDCITGTVLYLTSTELLESYIGKVIKIESDNLEFCYLVESSEICPEDPAALPGIIVDCFSNCETCIPVCACTRARNNSTEARRLTYIDCNNQIQETVEIIAPGRLSKKYCVLRWLSEEIEVINFGNCVDNECPEVPRPQKFVTPGYDTPICTPAHYERIVCRYSDGWYKKMLEERYGIADCCPDDYFQNNIKYELIHLQMLNDPDYECTAVRQGCAQHCSSISLTITRECPPEPPIEETEEESEENSGEVIDPEDTGTISLPRQVNPD